MITNKNIQDSFIKLLYEKPFDKITVKDIAIACGINRNTFYYHYVDINALVEDIVRDRFEKIGEVASHMEDFKKQCLYVIDWFIKFKEPVLNIYHSSNKDIVDKYAYHMAKLIAGQFVEAGFYSRGVRGKKYKTVLNFFTALTYGYILMILDHNVPSDIKDQFEDLFKYMGAAVDISVSTLTK